MLTQTAVPCHCSVLGYKVYKYFSLPNRPIIFNPNYSDSGNRALPDIWVHGSGQTRLLHIKTESTPELIYLESQLFVHILSRKCL